MQLSGGKQPWKRIRKVAVFRGWPVRYSSGREPNEPGRRATVITPVDKSTDDKFFPPPRWEPRLNHFPKEYYPTGIIADTSIIQHFYGGE